MTDASRARAETALRRGRACPDWYHEDNVFPSRRRMDRAHRPIVALACRTLRGRGGNLLDLGCGNGALLRKIHALEPRVAPFGIERDPARVAHARLLLPEFAANLFEGVLRERPDLVRAVVRAFVGGARHVHAEPDDAAGIAGRYIGVHGDICRRAFERNRPDVRALHNTEAMDRVLELMLALGYLTEKPKDFTDLRFVEEAL